MAYVDIATSRTDTDSPVTQDLLQDIVDNFEGLANGDTTPDTAPKIQQAALASDLKPRELILSTPISGTPTEVLFDSLMTDDFEVFEIDFYNVIPSGANRLAIRLGNSGAYLAANYSTKRWGDFVVGTIDSTQHVEMSDNLIASTTAPFTDALECGAQEIAVLGRR